MFRGRRGFETGDSLEIGRDWSLKCGVWSLECGVWSVECGVWSVECGVWSVECGVWSVECGVLRFRAQLVFDPASFGA
jgi:hypothetical protein